MRANVANALSDLEQLREILWCVVDMCEGRVASALRPWSAHAWACRTWPAANMACPRQRQATAKNIFVFFCRQLSSLCACV